MATPYTTRVTWSVAGIATLPYLIWEADLFGWNLKHKYYCLMYIFNLCHFTVQVFTTDAMSLVKTWTVKCLPASVESKTRLDIGWKAMSNHVTSLEELLRTASRDRHVVMWPTVCVCVCVVLQTQTKLDLFVRWLQRLHETATRHLTEKDAKKQTSFRSSTQRQRQ